MINPQIYLIITIYKTVWGVHRVYRVYRVFLSARLLLRGNLGVCQGNIHTLKLAPYELYKLFTL